MFVPAVEIRPARADDLPSLAAFIARLNARPEHQSLYCVGGTAREIRAALRDPDDFPGGWERSFMLAVASDEISAATGCQFGPDRTLGWLWGPWAPPAPDGRSVHAPVVLDRLQGILPRSLTRLDAFLNVRNRDGLGFLRSQGFEAGLVTHIYVLPRTAWRPPDERHPDCAPLRPAHEIAFARLHAEAFPSGRSAPAEDLLAGRDEEHVVFTATDGLRLHGYVCVSVNRAPREGFIDYLAVKPTARGRGVGTKLLQAALRWTFEDRRLPQAALCVSEWRAGAQRLYEQAGFRLYASGVGARREVLKTSPAFPRSRPPS